MCLLTVTPRVRAESCISRGRTRTSQECPGISYAPSTRTHARTQEHIDVSQSLHYNNEIRESIMHNYNSMTRKRNDKDLRYLLRTTKMSQLLELMFQWTDLKNARVTPLLNVPWWKQQSSGCIAVKLEALIQRQESFLRRNSQRFCVIIVELIQESLVVSLLIFFVLPAGINQDQYNSFTPSGDEVDIYSKRTTPPHVPSNNTIPDRIAAEQF